MRVENDDNRVGNIGEPGARKVQLVNATGFLGELLDNSRCRDGCAVLESKCLIIVWYELRISPIREVTTHNQQATWEPSFE